MGDRKEQQQPHNKAAFISHGLVDKLCILKPNTQENEQSFIFIPNQSHPPVQPHTGIKTTGVFLWLWAMQDTRGQLNFLLEIT